MCLNCKRPKCTNCLDPAYVPKGGWGSKPVIAYREGEEDMHFDSVAAAAAKMYCSAPTIRKAIWESRIAVGWHWRYAT